MTAMNSDDDDDNIISQAGSAKRARIIIRAVIFDLDGTLLDTESLSCRAVIEAFAATGLTIPQDVLASLADNPGGLLLLPWELKRLTLGLRGSGMLLLLQMQTKKSLALHSYYYYYYYYLRVAPFRRVCVASINFE